MHYSLHKVTEDPKDGFKYYPVGSNEAPCVQVDLEDLKQVAERWSARTKETCPHVSILNGQKCGLCGNKYQVTIID